MDAASIAKIRKTILPVIVRKGNEVACIGTAFVISSAGRSALLVTAEHVTAVFSELEEPDKLHHPSSPFFVEKALTVLKKVQPYVVWFDADLGPQVALVKSTVSMKAADLSCMVATFVDHVPEQIAFEYSMSLDTTPVQEGETVYAVGYPNMDFAGYANGDNQMSGQLHWPKGEVLEFYPQGGPTGQKTPCFSVSAGLPHGMSGGPVITQDDAGDMYVRGIVRSDFADQFATTSSGQALATAIWPLLLLPFNPPNEQGQIDWSKTLLDLQKLGSIVDKGDASSRINAVRDSEGYILDAQYHF